MKRPSVEFELFAPVVVVAGLSIGALILLLVVLAGRIDAVSLSRERSLVANGMQEQIAEIERAAAGQVHSGRALTLDQSFDHVFVLGPSGAPVYAMANGKSAPVQAYGRFVGMFSPLVAQVRRAQAVLGATPQDGGLHIEGSAPHASDIVASGSDVYVLTAAAADSTSAGALTGTGAAAPVVLTAARLGPGFLKGLSDRFLMESPQLLPGRAPRAAQARHWATAELRNGRGQAVAALVWSPAAPGRLLYSTTILPILLVVCSLAGIAFLTFGRGRRVAQGLVASEARAKHMALHDALTCLPNRVLFTDRLTQAIEQLRRRDGAVAVMCIDLDRFKEVNDTFGHHFGDELLREIARRLVATVRTSDTLARLGGDEFAIVLPDASGAAASGLSRRICEAIAAPVDLAVGRVFIGCSIGVTMVETADVEPVDAVRQADLALYRAKDMGRGQYCFFQPEMDASLRLRRAIEADLREALADGRLEMHYQPQVDARGQTVAVEALVRWDHPQRGPLAPAFFVPIAEECGLIDQLGVFTLKTAFRDSRRWPARVKVAVNISASQLRLKSFLETIRTLIDQTGADPKRFELEITEGVFLGDDPLVHDTLRRLRDLGFTLALDDFGTGYSSLSYLRRYPVDKIKIDGSFVAALGADQEADAVVGAIVRLAKALNLAVVAEGVETLQQAAACPPPVAATYRAFSTATRSRRPTWTPTLPPTTRYRRTEALSCWAAVSTSGDSVARMRPARGRFAGRFETASDS